MMSLLTPRRRYEAELLDSHSEDEALVLRSVEDIERSNFFFQGVRAAVAELRLHFADLPEYATLLDVGTGMGDVPEAAERAAAQRGIRLDTLGLDTVAALSRRASECVTHAVCGSGLALPFRSESVDIVMCSQTLHHFREEDESVLVREMNRVARVAVVVSDLRRSWIAAAGFWAASFPLRFHPVTRHDGVLSVLRGFTPAELGATVERAIGVTPRVHSRLGFRLTTSWKPVRREVALA
ncbi:MAG: methyltransferase domain-containing protein [Gemmatimonadota bacterium]|nr:methyltransferase domain-containing protein [Gemmatimonadota bacterium]